MDRGAHDMLFGKIKDWHAVADKYQLTHSYGLFRSMTGVGGRPEVIIEGSNNAEGPWEEYEFLYKPGNVSRKLPFIVPHQPRIDWQIWFAALGQYQQNPWFLSLVYRLLKNQPEVLHLIARNPFGDLGPAFIRARLYSYHFTRWEDSPKFKPPTEWWTREFKDEYMPAVAADNPSLVDFMKRNALLVEAAPESPSWILSLMRTCRLFADRLDGAVFVWAVTASVILARFCKGFVL